MGGKTIYACESCGEKFAQYPSQMKARAFCSQRCYWDSLKGTEPPNKGKREITEKPCGVCGKAITGMRSEVARRKYCSKECTAKAFQADVADVVSRYVEVDGCWLWTGSRRGGYGRAKLAGIGSIDAHRLSYEHHVGPIPDGLVIDHLCRNRSCINPAHLEPVTTKENIRRGDVGSPQAMRKHWETRRKRHGSDSGNG